MQKTRPGWKSRRSSAFPSSSPSPSLSPSTRRRIRYPITATAAVANGHVSHINWSSTHLCGDICSKLPRPNTPSHGQTGDTVKHDLYSVGLTPWQGSRGLASNGQVLLCDHSSQNDTTHIHPSLKNVITSLFCGRSTNHSPCSLAEGTAPPSNTCLPRARRMHLSCIQRSQAACCVTSCAFPVETFPTEYAASLLHCRLRRGSWKQITSLGYEQPGNMHLQAAIGSRSMSVVEFGIGGVVGVADIQGNRRGIGTAG